MKKVTGKVKEQAGKALGDAGTEAEGKADQAEGRVQGAVGHAKDAVREDRRQEIVLIICEEVAVGRGILLWPRDSDPDHHPALPVPRRLTGLV